jgi:CTP synthase
MRFTGHHTIGKTQLVEVIELPVEMHPWFVATQAHPEFKSRPNRPAPLYRDFIGAALAHEDRINGRTGVAEAASWTQV